MTERDPQGGTASEPDRGLLRPDETAGPGTALGIGAAIVFLGGLFVLGAEDDSTVVVGQVLGFVGLAVLLVGLIGYGVSLGIRHAKRLD